MSSVKIYTITSDELSPPVIGEGFCTDVVRHSDYAALEAKCAALGAENAGLKDFLQSRVDESICDKHIKTPATDAYRDELRAQGIEMAAKSDQFSMWVQQGLRSFAIGVRQGGAE